MRLLGLVVAMLSGGCMLIGGCGSPPVPDVPFDEAAEPATEAPPEQTKPIMVRSTSGYEGMSAWLLGVDVDGRRAFVRLNRKDPPRFAIDTIDLSSGERIDRWEATAENAYRYADRGDDYHPLTGSATTDALRLASMMTASGPRYAGDSWGWPLEDVSPDGKHFIFTERTDHLYLSDAGGSVRKLGNLRAQYRPRFSPDGSLIAYEACKGHPCRYAMYITPLQDALQKRAPRIVPGIENVGGPRWSADSKTLYTLGRASVRGATRVCVFAVKAKTRRWSTLTCASKGLGGIDLDPTTRRAVSKRETGPPGKQIIHYEYFDIATRKVLAKRSVDRAVGRTQLGDGVMLAHHQRGAMIVDLEHERRRLLPYTEYGRFDLFQVAWLGKRRVLVLSSHYEKSWQLLELDLDALLAER